MTNRRGEAILTDRNRTTGPERKAGLGLREAKEFVEAAPKIIKDGVSIEEAEALKAKFEELGAAITLK